MQPYAIGLDVGITSVGWAITALDNDKPCQIIGMGSRIFNSAEHPRTGASLAAPRREARSIRRRIRRRHLRNTHIRELLVNRKIVTEDQLNHLFEGKLADIYALRVKALDEKVEGSEFARILIHISQRRGFKSNRKDAASGEDGKLLTAINDNIKSMKENKYRTVAEMLLRDIKFIDCKRNKGGNYKSTVSRDMVLAEVHAIFVAQRNLGNEYAMEETENEYITILNSQRSFDDGPGKGSPYAGNQIERMIGNCTLEPTEKRAAKATYSFEYFSLLQAVNNMRLVQNDTSFPLTEEQRNTVIKLAHDEAEINYSHIRKALKISDDMVFNNVYYKDDVKACETTTKFPYMRSYHKMRKAYNSIYPNYIDNFTRDKLNTLAEVLIRYKTSDRLRSELQKHDFKDEEIDVAETLNFSGTGHISVNACEKLIPFMEKGKVYSEACTDAGYAFEAHEGIEKTLFLPPLGGEKKNDITNPVVARSISQTIKVVNAIIREMKCSPVYINIELSREMAKDFGERMEIRKKQEENRAENERILAELRDTYRLSSPSAHDIVKLRLYKEQDGICPYSQKHIPADLLFDNTAVQVDHIIPYSISFDDSSKNKVLVFAEENQNKGSLIPLQYLTGECKERYIKWVNDQYATNKVKRTILLKETITENDRNQFKARNLQDTRYATVFLLNYITDHLLFEDFTSKRKKHVTAINGSITSFLRKQWGISKVRADGDLHHAVDALVVACATDKAIQDISKYSRARETRRIDGAMDGCKVDSLTGEINKIYFPQPWDGFRKDLNIRMSDDPKQTLISQEGTNAVSYGKFLRPLFVSRMSNHKITGAVHQKTVFSARELSDGIAIKKTSLSSLTLRDGAIPGYYQPDSDRLLYDALVARLKEYNGNAKEAFKEPFFKPKSDGTQGPLVKSVKICKNITYPTLVHGGTGVAVNDTMIRIDVFHVPDDGYYYVPIYVADTVKEKLPNMACVAHKSYTEWKEMRDEDFVFSLYNNDLIHVEHKKGIILKKNNKDSSLPDPIETKEAMLYYVKSDITSASVACITHDNSYMARLGIKTLRKIEKYTVDMLGNITLIRHEKRMPFVWKKKK